MEKDKDEEKGKGQRKAGGKWRERIEERRKREDGRVKRREKEGRG